MPNDMVLARGFALAPVPPPCRAAGPPGLALETRYLTRGRGEGKASFATLWGGRVLNVTHSSSYSQQQMQTPGGVDALLMNAT